MEIQLIIIIHLWDQQKVVFNSECGLTVRLIHNEIICFGPKIRGLNIVLGTDLLKHLRTH